MAITENEYTGNGSTVLYSFTFPYLETTDIKVSLNGTVTTAYTLANATTIQFNTAPANGVAIRIYRQTDDAALAATFYSGSAIRSADLNDNFTQNLYVTQESTNNAATATSTANTALTNSNTAISTANSAVSTANTASSNASAAVSTANTASSNASAAVSTANTASSNATTAVNTANAATATANSAASDAATAISTANSAVSTANTASTAATNAVNTANSASSAASSAVSTANTASSNASAAVSTANTASSNATSAVNTANSALSTANAAASAVANAILYDIVANVAAIPASPANNDAVEVTDSTGIESFTPLTGIPGGFAGNSGLSVRIVYTTTGNTWTWIQYFPNDPETRYLKEAVTTSDTAPVSPSDGDLWYDSVGGRTYVYYDDGDSSQWVDTSPQGSGVSDAISEGDTSAEVIDTGSDGRFVVTTEGSERLRITSAGRVGIGDSSPDTPLHVRGSQDLVKFEATDAGATGAEISLVHNSASPANNDVISRINFSGNDSVATATTYCRIEGVATNVNNTDETGAITFSTRNLGTFAERVRISGSGAVGIGTQSPSHGKLTLFDPALAAFNALVIQQGNTGSTASDGLHIGIDSAVDAYITHKENRALAFGTANTERARIDASGRLLVGTSSMSGSATIVAQGNSAGSTSRGILYLSLGANNPADGTPLGHIEFSDSTPGRAATIAGQRDGGTWTAGSSHPGRLVFSTTADGVGSPTERLRIDSSGRVGIGTTPDSQLHVVGTSGTGLRIGYTNNTNYFDANTQIFRSNNSTTTYGQWDSSGRLLVGTASSSADVRAIIAGTSAGATGGGQLRIQRGSANPQNAFSLGAVSFTDSNEAVGASISAIADGADWASGDYPTRLVFSTTADGASSPTERMRIGNGGQISQFSDAGWENIRVSSASAAGTTRSFYIGYHSATGVNTGTLSYRVYTNGNVQNTNNSYGAISDVKLKENIVDASSQWDDLKALQVRNYNFKEGQIHTQIGLIAQEAELVSPGLVSESPDRDEDGNDLGTVTKSVNYSVLYMKAVKALQEAMTRIETLEAANTDLAARLTALEGGTN